MKILLKVTKYLFILFVLIFIILFFGILYFSHKLNYTMPDVINIQIYDKDENLIEEVNNLDKRNYVKLENIDKKLINAFISIEDKDFYRHKGINIKRIIGALINDIKTNDFSQGGSTITQQYVKNIYLKNEKTLKRKFNEALIALNLELKYTKDEILEGYLNTIYFDHGIYGVEDACRFYFNKSANNITLGEAAVIASIPKSPSNYSPIKNFENNKSRKNLILQEMLNDGIITNEEYQHAINEKIYLYGELDSSKIENAPYYIDCVLEELKELDIELQNGMKIHTNLDTNLNNIIINSFNKYFPNDSKMQIAIFATSNDGKILSILGGTNYLESTYNRATKSLRQPGSAIKPLLYYSALDNGFNVASTFYSTETKFNVNGIEYNPSNYNDIYAEQDISMAYALAVSDNIYAVKTHLYLGTDVLYNTIKEFGITNNINNNVSLALGTSEVNLSEITTAYSKIAAMGKDVKSSYINKIIDSENKTIYSKNYNYKQKFNSDTCYLLAEAMTGVFDYRMRYNISPTGASISAKLSKPYAAKTGSTDYDNWIIGFNNNITVGIWIGFDDNSIIDNKSTRFMKYIWADIMEEYNKNKHNTWYETPDGIIGIKLNPITGKIALEHEYSKYLYFKTNNLPTQIYL